MSFQPSKYQADIFDWIKTGTGNAVVDAKAGSGKTTTIVQALQHIPSNKKTIFLAFNKEIATTLKERVPRNVEARTLNSLGYLVWMKHMGRRVEVDGNKLSGLARSLAHTSDRYAVDSDDSVTLTRAPGIVVQLAKKAKVVGLVPDGIKGAKGLVKDTADNWADLAEHFSLDLTEFQGISAAQIIHAARLLLRSSIELKRIVDFDDQFYMPLVYDMTWPKYDWVFVDESQDVSDIQRAIVARLVSKTTRVVVVGDPNQSIYGFRGANPNSMEMLREQFNCKVLPLSISYRCAKSIVKLAQTLVPAIEPADTAPEGSIEIVPELKDAKFQAGDMVICRNIAPIIKMAYTLIHKRQPCYVRGREIGQGLAALIKKMRAVDLPELSRKVGAWVQREVARRIERDPDANVQGIVDQADSLDVIIEMATEQTIAGVLKEIDVLFGLGGKEPENAIVLSSIHRAKGLESARVWILNRSLMPSRYAKKEWEKQQERNVEYVAYTRAKLSLYFIHIDMDKKITL